MCIKDNGDNKGNILYISRAGLLLFVIYTDLDREKSNHQRIVQEYISTK